MRCCRFPHLSDLPLPAVSLLLRFQLCLQRGELRSAAALADSIAQASAVLLDSADSFPLQAEAALTRAELDWAEGRRRAADEAVAALLTDSEQRKDATTAVRCLLLLCRMRRLQAETGRGRGARGLTAAVTQQPPSASAASAAVSNLPLLLKASRLAEAAEAEACRAAVGVELCWLLLALGRATDALACIRPVYCALLEQAGTDALLSAMHATALCLIAAAEDEAGQHDAGGGEPDVASPLSEAAAVLRAALQAADSLRFTGWAVRLSYLLSRVCWQLGQREERDAAAQRFLLYLKHLQQQRGH